jgi:ribonucleoside-diphosphate reductase alpha chain
MGFADLLVELGILTFSKPCGPPKVWVASRRAEAASASRHRAGRVPALGGSRLAARGLRRRNATVTSIAPTGTLSILAGCAGGIEPFFALAFVRHVLDGETLAETNERFEAALRRAGAWSADLVEEVRARGSVRGIRAVPEPIRRLFPIASDIAPEAHLRIQEAFQRHVDNAVSKTINLPAETSPEEIAEIYTKAWRRGLKGIVPRGGSMVLVRARRRQVDAEPAGGCSEPRS